MDIPNKISKRGLIYFPDFCQLVLEKFRGDAVEGENFRQNMFKVIKIPSDMEEAPRFTLLILLTLFNTIYAIRTSLHCLNIDLHAYLYC